MMIAMVKNLKEVYAAIWLGSTGAGGRVQLTRRDGDLEVVGTNGYVLVASRIWAEFDGWADGDTIELGNKPAIDGLKQLLTKGHGGNAKPIVVSVEDLGYGSRAADFTRYCDYADRVGKTLRVPLEQKAPIDLEKFAIKDESCERGHLPVSAGLTFVVAKVMRIMGGFWTLRSYGPDRYFRLDMDGRDCFIAAMSAKF